jgi:hypothetical protein
MMGPVADQESGWRLKFAADGAEQLQPVMAVSADVSPILTRSLLRPDGSIQCGHFSLRKSAAHCVQRVQPLPQLSW